MPTQPRKDGGRRLRPSLAIVQQQPIQSVVVEIRGHLYDAKTAEARRDKFRLQAGQKLLGLRKRVEDGEAGCVSWWEWFETQDLGSRTNAEKLMRIASADDPEGALAAEQERERDVKRRQRQQAPWDVPRNDPDEGYDPVADALEIIDSMDDRQLKRFTVLFKRKYL